MQTSALVEPSSGGFGTRGPIRFHQNETSPFFTTQRYRERMLQLSHDDFESLVIAELDELPDEMFRGLDNVAFVVEDRPADGSLDLFGLYDGIALTDRGRYGYGELPDRIVVYREPHLDACDTLDELRDEVHVTLVHEIAHFYGIDDDELHRLGWE